ncbi:MAG: SPOR domain-containing protein [Dysgonamonadaceae bacterium]|jgi:cell division protein FtsN|nr:SPOR domain-containing protein [Dysgonamonadaceae bacterium]
MKSRFLLWGIVICFVCSFPACKSKQSAYKAAYERAREKPVTPAPVVEQVTTAPAPKPAPAIAEVKKERVTAVAGTGLKRFNVVIGSFQNKTNALSLKERMETEGFNVILAQNEAEMYRVIVASYDAKYEAAVKRDEIKAKYAPLYADAWILEQLY